MNEVDWYILFFTLFVIALVGLGVYEIDHGPGPRRIDVVCPPGSAYVYRLGVCLNGASDPTWVDVK